MISYDVIELIFDEETEEKRYLVKKEKVEEFEAIVVQKENLVFEELLFVTTFVEEIFPKEEFENLKLKSLTIKDSKNSIEIKPAKNTEQLVETSKDKLFIKIF